MSGARAEKELGLQLIPLEMVSGGCPPGSGYGRWASEGGSELVLGGGGGVHKFNQPAPGCPYHQVGCRPPPARPLRLPGPC